MKEDPAASVCEILHPGYGLKHEELGTVTVMVQRIEYQDDRILWTYQDVR